MTERRSGGSRRSETGAEESVSIVVSCTGCGTSYRLNTALLRGVRGVRIRCRRCAGFIDVLNPEDPAYHPESHAASDPSDREVGKEAAVANPAGGAGFPAAADRERKGGVSPDYVASRAVDLDLDWLSRNRCVVCDTASPEAEFYRMLRTRILHRTEGTRGVTVMVTSALPGEGKTTTAINLSFAFARTFRQTVLLVDADLKRQRIHEVLGFENDKGLADYLLDNCPLSDTIVWPGIEKLTVLSGGRTVTDSSELLGSPRMKALVEEMKSRYPERYVIFDVAPVLIRADALAFAPLVDCILFVVQAGRTSLQDINKAIKMLPQEKVLGLVLNRDPHAGRKDM